MPHLFWYLSLTSGLRSCLFSRYGNHLFLDRALLIFFFIGGLSYTFENVIKVIFDSYSYFPHLFKNAWYDSLWGALTSQAIFIPTTAMFIAAFKLNTLWIIGICFLVMGVEELFIRLGIYEHHWWKTIYTGILIFIGFNMAKWWDRMLMDRKTWIDGVNIYLLLILICNAVAYLSVSFSISHLFHLGVFQDPVRDSVFTEASLIFIHSIAVTFMLLRKWRWYWFLVLYVINWGLLSLFEKIGMVQFFHFWNPALYACLPTIVALLVYWLYKQIAQPNPKRISG